MASDNQLTEIDSPASPEPLPSDCKRRILLHCLAAAILSVTVFAVYSNTLHSPFLFDDRTNILENPAVRITSLTFENFFTAGFKSPAMNRPVANISLALNYYFHGYDVFGYHLVNILIHILAAICIYFLAQNILEIQIKSGNEQETHSFLIPLLAALIWAVHPIHTQSVTYIVQRMNSLAALFYILSVLLYSKARVTDSKTFGTLFFCGSVLAGFLALGSKEIAASLPLFLFLYEWFFFKNLNRRWIKRQLPAIIFILLCSAIPALLFLGGQPVDNILSTYAQRDFTITNRLLTEPRVILYYLNLLILPLPSRLSLIHDLPVSSSLLTPPPTLFAILTLTGIAAAAIYKAKTHRIFAFCLLWFLGNLLIESSVLGLEIIFEHRTYLPSMLLGLLPALLILKFPRHKPLAISMLLILAIVFSIWTYQRNFVWKDAVTFWKDCVVKAPSSLRAHNNLGLVLADEGNFSEAEKHFSEALKIAPGYVDARLSLGVVLKRQGRYSDAAAQYRNLLINDPYNARAHNNLGIILKIQGNLDQAVYHYKEALRISPAYAFAHHNLANALKIQGNLQEAAYHHARAARLDPELARARGSLLKTETGRE
ncbi:MAG: tetratricopeptide repeat protein [Proteobacteria bacterium]|nr:tetratricopeptide repeat protein [Pseudomonadota bacterium]MBU1708988.1 tetratricopeptide repeat protein [Pseudomonadota bacterium]